MKSWKTTLAGVLAAALVIGQQVLYGIDSDPQTVVSIETIVAQLIVAYGLIMARDNNVTSKRAGAK